MTSHDAFISACAPDHPEVRAILAFLDQILPAHAGDPMKMLRRVQAAVMLTLAGRMESRLLAVLDGDQQTMPSAALIRQASRARSEAMALLESLLNEAAEASPCPVERPAVPETRGTAGDASPVARDSDAPIPSASSPDPSPSQGNTAASARNVADTASRPVSGKPVPTVGARDSRSLPASGKHVPAVFPVPAARPGSGAAPVSLAASPRGR